MIETPAGKKFRPGFFGCSACVPGTTQENERAGRLRKQPPGSNHSEPLDKKGHVMATSDSSVSPDSVSAHLNSAPAPKQKKPRGTKRRGNGEGSIFQRPNGQWVGMVTTGRGPKSEKHPNGKLIRTSVYGDTKKEVQDKLARMQVNKLDGTLADPERLTVADYLERWKDAARPNLADTTFDNYAATIKNHVNPRIGGVQLAKVTPLHVQSLLSHLERDGVGAHTCRRVYVILRRAFKQAVKWRLLAINVCDAVDAPRLPKKDIQPLTAEQAGTLLAACADDPLNALYALAIGGGLRMGEIFALHWCDVDLATGTVTVRHTLQELNGKLKLKEPKTKKSRRRIRLPQYAVDALHEHRKQAIVNGQAGNPWVFCNSRGGPLRRSHFHADHYKPLLRRAGLPSIRFHDLRHTMATMMLLAGVHPKVVQERLGHSNIGMTMDTYSHVLPSMDEEAAGLLDALMAKSKPQGDMVKGAAG